MTNFIGTPIADEARDLMPETWDALGRADTFGAAALQRRHDRVLRKIFGVVLEDDEQDLLSDIVIEYCGKTLALSLIDPGIDYWSAQIMSYTKGEQENESYKDRAAHLKDMQKKWVADLAALWLEVEPLVPLRPRRVQDAPRVIQAGETVAHVTAQPDDFPPLYGLPEETTEQT